MVAGNFERRSQPIFEIRRKEVNGQASLNRHKELANEIIETGRNTVTADGRAIGGKCLASTLALILSG